ncbi:MAG: uroporphyrinogen-III synthase, partial [Rhodospirillales bacterium]|nr:uroporphyrinogen-III synthase [Rhodospirillales bacterium]
MAGLVLVTRPVDQAAQTARRLRAMGHAPLLAPALAIEARRLAPVARVQAVLVTSANALASLPEPLRQHRLLAVGDATAGRARAAGFTDVASAGRDAAALAALATRLLDPAAGPVLLAVGEGHGVTLAAALRDAGFS